MTGARPAEGVLLVDKPVGITSHDVVARARRALGTRRIGHAGTLDPFASGLLVLLVGRVTRLLPYVNGEPKVYDAVIRFGTETSTDDRTGEVVRTAALPSSSAIDEAIVSLTGVIDQIPPAYSAKQVAGERAYAAARRGAPLELRPARVTVSAWETLRQTDNELEVRITCGTGTYIRSLARDLGRLTSSAAHLRELRRVRSGAFDVADAIPGDALSPENAALRPALDALQPITLRVADASELLRVSRGQPLSGASDGGAARAAVVDADGSVLAIAERMGEVWQPRVVLADV